MNKYVKKGLCLVLATGLIASSFAGCAKVNYVTEGAIKAIHQIKDGSWKKQAEGEETGSSEDTSVLEKSFEAGKYGGVEFKSLEDVANYYKEAYDYTKTLTAEYVNDKGQTETFYKLLGDEKINVGKVMIDGKENAVINKLVRVLLTACLSQIFTVLFLVTTVTLSLITTMLTRKIPAKRTLQSHMLRARMFLMLTLKITATELSQW